MTYLITRRAALIGGAAALALSSLSPSSSQAAAKIQRLVSPGGIAPSGTSPSHFLFSASQRMTHLRGLNGSPLRLTEARL